MLASCGSIESCDCLISIYENNGVDIEISSDVILQYGRQIRELIENILSENNISNIKVVIDDKGALDYTIKARLLTALRRGGFDA